MVLRTTPPGEDPTHGSRARPIPFFSAGTPPGEDGIKNGESSDNKIINAATAAGTIENNETSGDDPAQPVTPDTDFLRLVREAESQALLYQNQNNKRSWSMSYRAWHNEHFSGSKYLKPDWRNRSKIFVPKTRSAVRKDAAAVMASLFNSIDAINCLPGNEGDKMQRASAAVVEEIVNYRTDRASGKAAIPWFTIANGARQDSIMTGVCLSKQSWKLELRKQFEEQDVEDEEEVDEQGAAPLRKKVRSEVWKPEIDRPEIDLIPPESFVIDPAADWSNPAQSASYIIIKWPMRRDEIRRRQESPVGTWHDIPDEVLRGTTDTSKFDMEAIRRARESGIDRYDEAQTGYEFQIIWVYEVFMRVAGDDWTFFSVADRAYLTNPRPVREVYPAHFGERPLAMGYGSLESHRLFPMSPVESWQELQKEINDLRNLALDATKQNVMPVTKIVRGRGIDIDQVKRRSFGTAIIVSKQDDVTWEKTPDISSAVPVMNRDLELEFDDLAGQFNAGTTENNNALSRTLGGLKLASGSANSVQEYDIRIWVSTWVEPAMAQFVQLIQYYESDPIILGLCGERAQIFQKYGVDSVTNELLENQVLVRVSVGLGAGDPMARLQKFQTAATIAGPLLAQSPQFQSGEYQIDAEAVMEEVFGAAGYRDGGMRFIKKGPPKPNPLGDLPMRKLEAEIKSLDARGKSSLMSGLAALAKAELGDRALESDNANSLMDQILRAHDMGHQHAHMLHDRLLAATDHGHRHGVALAKHRQEVAQSMAEQAAAQPAQMAANAQNDQTQQAPVQAQSPDIEQKLDTVIELLKALITRQSPGFPAAPYGR